MKKMSITFVVVSFVSMILACVLITSFYAVTMAKNSNKAMKSIGAIYMDGMNTEITRHFQTTIDLRLNQLNVMIEKNPPAEKTMEEISDALADEGMIRGFQYVAFMSDTGSLQMIYGDQIKLLFPEKFLTSLNNEETQITTGISADGIESIVLGVSTVYPMKNGENCTAIIAGFSTDYFNSIISSDDNNSITFTAMIRRNGDYVIKPPSESRMNYFDRIDDLFCDFEGKTSDQYKKELKDAMDKNRNYSSVFFAENERRHLYCSPLDNSEWYLITMMPYGQMDEIVESLSDHRIELIILSMGVIITIFIVMFTIYYKGTHKQLEELELARKSAVKANRAKSDFLSNMSHDIRTPMNAIVGMTIIAAANIDNKPQLQNCLKKIMQSNRQLLGLINDILDMSKIESGKMTIKAEQVSLKELISDIVTVTQPQIKEKQQKFDIYIGNIITENVFSDGIRLNQVIMNILSNAIKFTPKEGSIEFSVYQETSPIGDNYVRVYLEISDNGIGMSEEFKNKIFDSFAREDNKRVDKTEGTGLGMAITKYIVDAMNGTIEVESKQGKGTKFRVVIDMEKAPEDEAEMRLPSWNMLVVDDDEALCHGAAASLNELGINAEYALSGEDALTMIKKRIDDGNGYDIVLLDWCMKGMSGIDTARSIHEDIESGLPIIFISAYDWSDVEEEAKNVGVSGFIPKPLFKSTLYHALRKFDGEPIVHENVNTNKKKDYSEYRLLVAEDNDLNWEIVNELLSEVGFNLTHAENGKVCVDTFKQAPEGYYNAILMDVRMPIMTGYEATVEIRALDRADAKNIPIIAMTADAFSDDIKNCLESGMNAHIAKPIDLPELLRQLDKYIGNSK